MASLTSGQIPQTIINTAQQYGVPPNLALEVALKESGFNQAAISPAGAIGIFQLMPGTAASLGVDPTDATQNIQGGVQYLGKLLAQFGDTATALAAYNWGPGNVSRAVASGDPNWLADQAPSETQNYVSSIMAAIGQSYQVSVTPSSIMNGAAQVAGPVVQNAVQGVDSTSIWMLTGIAIGAYLLFDFLGSD